MNAIRVYVPETFPTLCIHIHFRTHTHTRDTTPARIYNHNKYNRKVDARNVPISNAILPLAPVDINQKDSLLKHNIQTEIYMRVYNNNKWNVNLPPYPHITIYIWMHHIREYTRCIVGIFVYRYIHVTFCLHRCTRKATVIVLYSRERFYACYI